MHVLQLNYLTLLGGRRFLGEESLGEEVLERGADGLIPRLKSLAFVATLYLVPVLYYACEMTF